MSEINLDFELVPPDFSEIIQHLWDKEDEARLQGNALLEHQLRQEIEHVMVERELTTNAETSLIKAMLTDPEGRETAMAMVQANDFHRETERILFNAIREMDRQHLPIDQRYFMEYLKRTPYRPDSAEDRRSLLDIIGFGENQQTWCVQNIREWLQAPLHPAAHYAALVRERAVRWRMSKLLTDVQEAMKRPDADLNILLMSSEAAMTTLHDRLAGGSAGDDLLSWYDIECEAIDLRRQADQRGYEDGFKSPLKKLNTILSPITPPQLVVIAARPRIGKTSFGLQMAYHAASVQGQRGLFVSIEMSRKQLASRRLLVASGLSRWQIDQILYRRDHANDIYGALETAALESLNIPLLMKDTPAITPRELLLTARRAKRKLGGLDFIIVDYLQKMHADDGTTDDTPRVGKVARGLKEVAKRMQCPVIALAQIGREAEKGGKDNRPALHHLRDSGWIEQEADVVIALHIPDIEDKTRFQIGVLKQRDGEEGWVEVGFDHRHTWFYESPDVIPGA